jgi:hypothetical protein
MFDPDYQVAIMRQILKTPDASTLLKALVEDWTKQQKEQVRSLLSEQELDLIRGHIKHSDTPRGIRKHQGFRIGDLVANKDVRQDSYNWVGKIVKWYDGNDEMCWVDWGEYRIREKLRQTTITARFENLRHWEPIQR